MTRAARALALALGLIAGGCSSSEGDVPWVDSVLHDRFPDAREGDAFERLAEQGTSVPVRPSDFVAVGLIGLRNTTDDTIAVIGAEPVWADDGVSVEHLGVAPPGAAITGAVTGRRYEGSVPLGDAPPVPPAAGAEDAHLLTFEAVLEEGADEGILLGIDVFYERDSEVFWQRFALIVLLCDWDTHADEGCSTYRGRDSTELDFEPLLAEILAEHEA